METINSVQKNPIKSSKGLSDCCCDTLDRLVDNNSMMFCPDCKCLIKSFTDKSAFNNYIKFCKTRRRDIVIGEYQNKNIVTFKSYD